MNRSGATVPVQSMKDCVVYDSTSGQIHHHHRVLTLVGGREPTKDQMAADSLRTVRNRRNAPSGVLHVLHIHHDDIEPGKRYRVDPQKRALVSHE